MSEKITELLKSNQKTHKKLDTIIDQNDELLEKNDELQDEVEEISEKLDIAKDDRVVKTINKGEMPVLIIMKDPDEKTTMKYHAIRTKQKLANIAIRKYVRKHKNGKVLFKCANPNAINFWDRINEGDAVIKRSGNNFKLKPGQTEKRMITKFKSINDEKYVV